MDYKTHLKIAIENLEKAEIHNPKLSPIINEVAKAYKSKPKLRKMRQASFIDNNGKVRNVSKSK